MTNSGASELALKAARGILELNTPKNIEEYLIKLVKNRPSIIPLVNLANRCFLAEEKSKEIQLGAKKFINDLKTKKKKAIKMLNIYSGKKDIKIS
ncbi:MAG: hypothetical protein ACOC85_04520 [Thermoplasmatota archaeon]